MNNKEQQYKYFAFISYNSRDTKWGKRLQNKLEGYRMPSTLCYERGWERTPIKPVFFAPTDIQPGELTEELQARLRASRNLIVICSPHSAHSEWVGREIKYFHSLGRAKQIHFFIVDGEPHSSDPQKECFNPVIETLGIPEILGANIHEKVFRMPWMNRERAYVQLISKLLDVEFDAIWRRHRRRLINECIAWTIAIITVLTAICCAWNLNKPVDICLRINEVSAHNKHLPPLKDADVTMILKNEEKRGILRSLNDSTIFANIPRRILGESVHIKAVCQDYTNIDTIVVLSENISLNITRHAAVYGDIRFQLWNSDGKGVPDVAVKIAGCSAISDKNGNVSLFIPLERQSTKYYIESSIPLLKDTLPMPCGDDAVVRVRY